MYTHILSWIAHVHTHAHWRCRVRLTGTTFQPTPYYHMATLAQFVAPDWYPQLAVWLGGMALAELSTFRGMWISREKALWILDYFDVIKRSCRQ